MKYIALFVAVAGCIEPYEFIIRDMSPTLVVESYLSDKSYRETQLYPSDGRYFTVKLSETGNVTNTRSRPVNGARVELLSSEGETWIYTTGYGGVYTLYDADFKARTGTAYKLRVSLPDESVYESAWETLPDTDVPPMGQVGFAETEKQMYVMEAGKWALRTLRMVTVNVQLPENTSGEPLHYRWTFSPMWIYVAPLSAPSDPNYRCWATDASYLSGYTLQVDRSGKYRKELFEILAVRNERIFEKISVLVVQQSMTEGYFNFWREMKEQQESSALSGIPPYNLKSNFESLHGGKKVSGYFGVTSEQAARWYFDISDLSYDVVNTLKGDCLIQYGPDPPAAECFDCRQYSFGKATTLRPAWWSR